MNPAIRAVVRRGLSPSIRREARLQFVRLGSRDVGGIIERSGTMLGTSGCPAFLTEPRAPHAALKRLYPAQGCSPRTCCTTIPARPTSVVARCPSRSSIDTSPMGLPSTPSTGARRTPGAHADGLLPDRWVHAPRRPEAAPVMLSPAFNRDRSATCASCVRTMSRSVIMPTTRGQALPPMVTITAPTCSSFISKATSASVSLGRDADSGAGTDGSDVHDLSNTGTQSFAFRHACRGVPHLRIRIGHRDS